MIGFIDPMTGPANKINRFKRLFARRRRIGSAGFTLVELLVVLAILGLIAAIAVPQTIGYLGRAKTNTAGIRAHSRQGDGSIVGAICQPDYTTCNRSWRAFWPLLIVSKL